MSLGAFSIRDICGGQELAWSWKREGVALGVDTLTLLVLGILATLVATGIVQTQFPALVHNPIFWSLVGAGGALIIWDVLTRICKQRTNEAHVLDPVVHSDIPQEKSANSELIPIKEEFVVPYVFSTLGDLLPSGLIFKISGLWESGEIQNFKKLMRTSRWQYLGHAYKQIPSDRSFLLAGFEFFIPTSRNWVADTKKQITCGSKSITVSIRDVMNHESHAEWSIDKPCVWSDSGGSTALFDLPRDVTIHIFEALPFSDQMRFASTCKYLCNMTRTESWFNQINPPLKFLQNVNEATGAEEVVLFKNWAKICDAAGSRCIYLSNSAQDLYCGIWMIGWHGSKLGNKNHKGDAADLATAQKAEASIFLI